MVYKRVRRCGRDVDATVSVRKVFHNERLHGTIQKLDGSTVPRVVMKVFNLEDQAEVDEFVKGGVRCVTVPGTNKEITYDPLHRTGIGISKIGVS